MSEGENGFPVCMGQMIIALVAEAPETPIKGIVWPKLIFGPITLTLVIFSFLSFFPSIFKLT